MNRMASVICSGLFLGFSSKYLMILLAWLFGTVTARITGAQPEDFLNLCARENLVLWRMVQRDLFTLEVQVTARQYARLCQLAQGAQCGVELEKRQGLPYFFLRFRRRYALLAGVALCLVLFAIGSRTVLTIDVTGNETVTREEIISQLCPWAPMAPASPSGRWRTG